MNKRRKKLAGFAAVGVVCSLWAAYAAGTASVPTNLLPSDYEDFVVYLPPSEWGFSRYQGVLLGCECVRVPDGRLTVAPPDRHGIYEVYWVSKNAPRWRCPDEKPCRLSAMR